MSPTRGARALSLVGVVGVALVMSCRPALPFGRACTSAADCDDHFVCDDDACVPDPDDPPVVGEGEGDAGEGEAGEGEAGEGEGEPGEGEGESVPGVELIDITGLIGDVQAAAMDERGGFMAIAVVDVYDALHGNARLDVYHRNPSGNFVTTGVVADVGTFGHWVDVAVDANHDAWLCYTQPNAASSGAVTSIIGLDADGAVIAGPVLLVDDGGSASPRCDVGVTADGGTAGGVGVVVKGGDGAVSYAEAPDFVAAPIAGLESAFSDNELQRVALAYDAAGNAHVMAQRGGDVIHAFQSGSASFTVETADHGDNNSTYVSAAFGTDGVLRAAYDIEVSFNLVQCVSTWNGTSWSLCTQVPVDFNTHSDALAVLADGGVAVAYADATTESPVLARGALTDLQAVHLDANDVQPSDTTIAVLDDGSVAVAYAVSPSNDSGRVKLAIVDP